MDTRFSFCAFASLKLLVGCAILCLTYIYVCSYQKNPVLFSAPIADLLCGEFHSTKGNFPYNIKCCRLRLLLNNSSLYENCTLMSVTIVYSWDETSNLKGKWYCYDHRYLFHHQGRLDAINLQKAVEYVLLCMNFDGGFGCRPGSESHAGQVNSTRSLSFHSF